MKVDTLWRSRFRESTRQRLSLGALVLILAFLIWASPWSLARYAASFVLLWVLPGLVWGLLIPRHALSRTESLVVSLGLSFVVSPVTILLLAYMPGPLTRSQLLAALAGAMGLPLALSFSMHRIPQVGAGARVSPGSTEQQLKSVNGRLRWRKNWVWVPIVALIVVGLRVTNLNYSEFQGDEATVVMRAARALEGDNAILFQHKKGPAELTLIMGSWRLTGILNEWMARLPFTWANVLGLVGVFLFCRRLSDPRLGGVTVGLLAIEGYLVAFGRIVQYQSLAFALSTLGLLCLLAYYVAGHSSLIVVGACLLSGGLLAHYDAILALPAGLLLIGARLWSNRKEIRPTMGSITIAVFVGLVLIGLFYVPFLQTPSVAPTASYITGRVGGALYNNLRGTFILGAVYDSVYYLILVLLAFTITLLTTWAKWCRAGWAIGGILFVATMTAVVWPELWLVGDTSLVWIPFGVLLLGALLAPDQSMAKRAAWVWFGVPSMVYLFFVAVPRTHVHTFFTAWVILAGMGLIEIARWLSTRSRVVRWSAHALGVVLYALCGCYAIIMFVDHTPEYRRTFPQSKYPIYWTPYEQIPEQGLFGFPYRAGWKVVGYLVDRRQLGDHYNSNEEPPVTDYYARQTARWECPTPDVYITAANVQDEVYIRWDQLQSDYQPAIQVTVGGQAKLTIHRRDVSGPPETYPVEDYASLFDQGTMPDRYQGKTPDRLPWAPPEVNEVTPFVIGNFARLIGYRLHTDHAFAGGYVDLILLWEVLATPPIEYTVFTHLHDGAAMRGQLDSRPVCGHRPTTGWRTGEIIVDPYRIPVRNDAPTSLIPLTIGMYDPTTLARLEVSTANGLPSDDSIHLTDIAIRGP